MLQIELFMEIIGNEIIFKKILKIFQNFDFFLAGKRRTILNLK